MDAPYQLLSHKLSLAAIGIILCATLFLRRLLPILRNNRPSSRKGVRLEVEKQDVVPDPYEDINPLVDFDWKTTKPIQLRPFKPVYHLTMALQNCSLSDLIEVDDTYLDRIKLRRSLAQTKADVVARCNPRCVPAVSELYTWLTGTYLPRRFPTMFELVTADQDLADAKVLHNKVTDELIPLNPPQDGVDTLKAIASNIDTDFFLLLPSTKPDELGKYALEAYINCFPSGFDPREKLNCKLADIHAPVPHYDERLEKSMDRFFASLPTGKVVKRQNWSINTSLDLFILSGHHIREGDDVAAVAAKEVSVETMALRCERQTLHRLPESGALVFAFKTYLYPVKQVKEEGNGAALADAIDGLTKGNAPRIFVYKSGVVWGDTLQSYLRS